MQLNFAFFLFFMWLMFKSTESIVSVRPFVFIYIFFYVHVKGHLTRNQTHFFAYYLIKFSANFSKKTLNFHIFPKFLQYFLTDHLFIGMYVVEISIFLNEATFRSNKSFSWKIENVELCKIFNIFELEFLAWNSTIMTILRWMTLVRNFNCIHSSMILKYSCAHQNVLGYRVSRKKIICFL